MHLVVFASAGVIVGVGVFVGNVFGEFWVLDAVVTIVAFSNVGVVVVSFFVGAVDAAFAGGGGGSAAGGSGVGDSIAAGAIDVVDAAGVFVT